MLILPYNSYEIRGEVTAIFLYREDGLTKVETLVDTADLAHIASLGKRWFASDISGRTVVLAHKVSNRGTVYLSRWILGIKQNRHVLVDYENHNSLDNRRANLMIVTKSASGLHREKPNKNNTSGLAGVTWHKIGKKWAAQLTYKGENHYLGLYEDKYEAAAVVAAKREQFIKEELENI